MTDTHAHFRSVEDYPDLGALRVLAVGCEPELNRTALAVAQRANIRSAIGLDYSQMDAPEALFEALVAQVESNPQVAAIGECGMDFHHASVESEPRQAALLRKHLELAKVTGLPVIFHVRESEAQFLACYDGCPAPGVVHSFTGDRRFAEAVLERGLMISFSGIVTFRNADALREVARWVPLDRMLVETDSPYLAPVPMRGRENRPDYVRHTARCLAELRGMSLEELEVTTDANAERLFGPWA